MLIWAREFLLLTSVIEAIIDEYICLIRYAYETPAGCADETLNYYNGATAVD